MRNNRYKNRSTGEMKNQIKYIAVAFTLLLASGCEKDVAEPQFPVNQKVLFQFEYINNAWGYQHAGWLIDSAGSVHCYRKPDNWTFPDSSGFIAGPDMEANLSAADSICGALDKETLVLKMKQLEQVSIKDLTDPVPMGNDMGIGAYLGYAYDRERNSYRQIVLAKNGDYQVENTSVAARRLVEWMKSVDRMVD